jgi:hypothetical protein
MPTPADRLRASGPIPFAAFMEEALYGEGGYYRRDDLPIGEEGDFVTGSSFSLLFGRATARLLRRLDGALGRPADFFEAGSGPVYTSRTSPLPGQETATRHRLYRRSISSRERATRRCSAIWFRRSTE